jgi:hypothetical protein
MGTDHPPRDKQAHFAKPSLLVAEPDFAGFWFSYRTSSAKTSFTQDNAFAVSWQNRSQCWRAHAPCPRGHTYLR